MWSEHLDLEVIQKDGDSVFLIGLKDSLVYYTLKEQYNKKGRQRP